MFNKVVNSVKLNFFVKSLSFNYFLVLNANHYSYVRFLIKDCIF